MLEIRSFLSHLMKADGSRFTPSDCLGNTIVDACTLAWPFAFEKQQMVPDC